MRILIVLPPNMPSGGNWTYSGRLQRGLKSFGINIDIKPLDQVTEADYLEHDIIHSFNAYLTGRHMAPVAKRLGKPLVLTMTGTDVNEHLNHPETRPSMVEVVDYASRIVLLTEDAGERLAAQYPSAGQKSQVINLGIDLPSSAGKTRADFGFADDEFVFLLVAGVRGVKRPLDALAPLSRVHEQYQNVRFVLAGAVLDQELFRHVQESFAATDFARYIGEFPYEEVSDLYRAGDVVMNTSSSEGLSHALLEAMSVGRPIFASNVPGNRDLIVDGVNGFLYASEDEFVEKATLLCTNDAVRERVQKGALQTIEELYSATREREAFLKMYNEVLQEKPCAL
jgi:L-malate glycosyltransferase